MGVRYWTPEALSKVEFLMPDGSIVEKRSRDYPHRLRTKRATHELVMSEAPQGAIAYKLWCTRTTGNVQPCWASNGRCVSFHRAILEAFGDFNNPAIPVTREERAEAGLTY